MRRYESPYHPVPDDYRWSKPDGLAKYCWEFAAELLLKGVTRTPDDRLKLTTHYAALLMKIAETIAGTPIDGRSLEIYCWGGGSPSRAFTDVIFQAKKSERRIYIARATQLVLGNDTDDWFNPYRGKLGTRSHVASEIDAGFFILLRELDHIHYQREMDARDIAAGRITVELTNREGGEEQEPWQEVQKRRQASALHTVHNSRRKKGRK